MAVITIAEDSVPLIETDDETLLLRIRATQQYTTYEGVAVLVGDGIYLEYSCPVTSHVAAVPVTTIYSTSDNISNLDPRWTAEFWDATGTQFRAPYYQNYRIPQTPTSTTKEDLDKFNAAPARLFVNGVYDTVQVDSKITAALTGSNAAPMLTTRLGTAKLSTAAVDATQPIVVGNNDTRVGGVSGSSTKASLPTPSVAGRTYRVTNDRRGIWRDTASLWTPTAKINVQDWGAKGDGSTNDTAAITAACAAAAGRRLFFPDTGSDYIVNNNVATLLSGSIIEGEISGVNSLSQIRLTAANKTIFTIGEDTRDVCLENIALKSTSLTGTTAIKMTGAASNSSQRFLFRNLTISAFNKGLYVLATDGGFAWQCSYIDMEHCSIADGNTCIHLNTLNCELNFKDGQLGALQDGFGVYVDNCGSLRLSEVYAIGPAGAGAICVLGVPNPAFADSFLYMNGAHGEVTLDHCLAENYRYFCQQKYEDNKRPFYVSNCDASALVDLANDTTWVSIGSTYATDNFTATGDTGIYSFGDTFKTVDKCGNATVAKGSFVVSGAAKVIIQSTFLGTEHQRAVHIGTDVSTADPAAVTTPLLEIGDATADRILVALGQTDGSRVLNNYFKVTRNSSGELVVTATQADPNNGLKMNMPLSITGSSSASLSSANFAKLNYDTVSGLLQFSTNGSAYKNFVNAVTTLTANRLQKASGNGVIANSSITDDGSIVSTALPFAAATFNKVAITQPASGSTLTIVNGKTLTVGNTLTLAGVDGTTMTLPSTSATLARTDAANTFTGHQTIEGITSTGATGTGKFVFDNAPALTAPTATTLAIGSGTVLTKVLKGTVTIDPASIAATTFAVQTFTLTGAVAGDTLILNIPAAGLTAGLMVLQAWVSAADTLKIAFYNSSGGSIDESSASWNYCLIRS